MMVNGLVSVRQYERSNYFRSIYINDLEKSTNVTFSQYMLNRWMAIHLDILCLTFSLIALISAINLKGTMPNEILAFSFQILTDMILFFSFSLRYAAEIETYLTSA